MNRISALLLALTLLFSFLLIADVLSHRFVHSSLTQKGSIVDQRFDASAIDWEGADIQSCHFSHLWKVFPFQTCYVRSSNPELDYFVYQLTGPPKFFASPFGIDSGRTPKTIRFSIPIITSTRYVIYSDGTIEDARDITCSPSSPQICAESLRLNL